MSDKRPKPGTEEFYKWLNERAKARGQEMLERGPVDFDERGVIFGSEESLNSTDAEAFPDEIEEYRPEDRKPRLAHERDKD
ncbi:hypothetical protein BTA51_17770 [Hahella sp. CCB-MM4]|uniref:hypothetical protein n=1 Tax=Hahella sp. (strain CCB-MM4) TaxID=1926491 RepID=UPI000B9BC79D|nr:hypothetical protein [Hahella sp. CCB-MM4]OZG72195.1 hypothetical protein BTA51_17770 [Hahella sp. CCB-MM4]